jgi:MSHA biogenesis protein MshJ
VFLGNALLLEPLRAKQKRLVAEIGQQQKELETIQQALARSVQTAAQDPNAANRARLAAIRDALTQLNSRIAQEQRRFTPPDRMRSVLEEVLRRNKGLKLVDLKTLPAAPVGTASAGSASGVYRHGIEFTVSGRYADLYEYLRALEDLPTQLYWRRAELAVGEHPVLTLKLTAYTVSFDPAWLIV